MEILLRHLRMKKINKMFILSKLKVYYRNFSITKHFEFNIKYVISYNADDGKTCAFFIVNIV